jgi:hypothetical protein
MSASENRSEVARLRQRIAEEYEAAMRGLTGLAAGTATHEFITKRMEQMGACHETLKQLVGEQEAARMLAQTLEAL